MEDAASARTPRGSDGSPPGFAAPMAVKGSRELSRADGEAPGDRLKLGLSVPGGVREGNTPCSAETQGQVRTWSNSVQRCRAADHRGHRS